MLKRFIDGFTFGSGFGVAFVFIWYATAYVIYPLIVDTTTERISGAEYHYAIPSSGSAPSQASEPTVSGAASGVPFHELTLDQQIELSSVIALAEFVASEDGQMKAIITEFLKKEPDTVIYYKPGDEHPSSSYYPRESSRRGDGLVIFFVGSPAKMQMSMTYFGDRIGGLGDMPIKLLKQRCDDKDA